MAFTGFLTDRASLKRALYRLMDTDDADDDLIEHDNTGETLEGVYLMLQQGLESAQLHVIDKGMEEFWLTETSALTTTGSDPDRYVDLTSAASDLLRMYGDDQNSALRSTSGVRWGTLVDAKDRHRVRGNYYYLRKERLYLAKGASLPTGTVMDYIYRLPILADDTDVDFPDADRPLIVAFAAVHAMEENWLPGGPEMEQKLERNLLRRKNEAYRRARRSQKPKTVDAGRMLGDHWFAT
jgi:hypothetical protein